MRGHHGKREGKLPVILTGEMGLQRRYRRKGKDIIKMLGATTAEKVESSTFVHG